MVTWESLKSLFGAIMYSPAEIYAALRLRHRERRFEQEFSPASGSVFGRFGAEMSVRERGAADSFGTYIRTLDLEKYTRIIERLLIDTVLDFLAEKDVDISAFAASASAVINGDVYNIEEISGGNNQLGRDNRQTMPAPGGN